MVLQQRKERMKRMRSASSCFGIIGEAHFSTELYCLVFSVV